MAFLTLFIPGEEPDRLGARVRACLLACLSLAHAHARRVRSRRRAFVFVSGFAQSSFLGIVSWQFIIVSITPITGTAPRAPASH
jgi:hypothetical protein